MSILEAMANEKNIKEIMPKMGFEHFNFVTPINHSRGLAILWNNRVIYASVLHKESRVIHMLVHDTTKTVSSIISGVCPPAQEREKDVFWDYLVELNEVIDNGAQLGI